MSQEKTSEQGQARPIDKKRIAICGGSLGRETKSLVRGQIVDVGISDPLVADSPWDFITGLFAGEEKNITPFLDFSLAPVRKPILVIELFDESGKKVFASDQFPADDDGFFSYEIRKKLSPGKYIFQVVILGLNSYRQFTKDIAYLSSGEKSKQTLNSIAGKGNLRILAENYSGLITTSDIDQTYLATEIDTGKGKFMTLFETPDQKFPLPGMPEFYQHLRSDSSDTPLCFISASPHFFRRTLLATIKKDGILIESLHLKYLEGTVKGVIDKVVSTFINIDEFLKEGVTPAYERVKKFLGSSYQSLFDQLTYKLTILIQDRIYQPKAAREILLGDNTESDYFIFTLYQFIITGKISGDALEEYLYHLNFLGRDAVTRDNAKLIRKLADECLATHGPMNSVDQVFINMTQMGPMADEMEENIKKALPAGLSINSEEIRMYYPTEGALGFALILHSLGILQFKSVVNIASSLVGKWMSGKVLDDKYILSLSRNLSVPDFAMEDKETLRDLLERALKY